MIVKAERIDTKSPVVIVDVGNTMVGIATWHDNLVKTPLSVPTDDATAFDEAYRALVDDMPDRAPAATVIGSVVPETLARVRAYVADHADRDALVIGERITLPLDVAVDDPKAIGVDRVCAAAAAFDQLQHACTIVDFGTAVTVDLVDDEGTLCGGAILPGARIQLKALHTHAAQLPELTPCVPDRPYGRNTVEAMQVGVFRGLAGAVRGIVEGYATSLNRWPHVIATGGDLNRIVPLCDFVDSAVEHLALRGVGLAYRQYIEALDA